MLHSTSSFSSQYVTLLLFGNQEYRFLLRQSHENFPCLLSLSVYEMCTSGSFLVLDIPQFLLDLFLGRPAIPSPYSQVSASLFKISQLFVRSGE